MDIENLDEGQARLILFLFLYIDQHKKWKDFEQEIKYHNRFFPKCELLDDLKDAQKGAEYIVNKGKLFYRARPLHSSFLEISEHKQEKREIIDLIVSYFPDIAEKQLNLDYVLDVIFPVLSGDQHFLESLKKILQKKKKFWGYGKKGSDATPIDRTSNYRANPKNISYLYVANDIRTAIMEVRPSIDQQVSVATIELKESLRLYNLCQSTYSDEEFQIPFTVSAAFSRPNYGNELDYLPTQYICEFIKELGFDGVRFRSSLNPNGINVVLFDTATDKLSNHKSYKITGTKVYAVTKLDLEFNQIAPPVS